MPDLLDRIYCSEQIHIPPTFPYIMKLYCKAAIRTQPYDLLKWSAAYFRALANGEEPPAKERIEYPPYDSPSGLTPGYIKILINQFGKDPETTITAQTLFQKWNDICLDEYLLVKLIALLGANTTVNWTKFVGVCAGFISKTLSQTMILICELFTEEPEGGMASVPYELFIDLYIFLAEMECGPLTPQEILDQEAIMEEEDICEVAEKIRKGVAEEEVLGEYEHWGKLEEEEGETDKEVMGEGDMKVLPETESIIKVQEEESVIDEEEKKGEDATDTQEENASVDPVVSEKVDDLESEKSSLAGNVSSELEGGEDAGEGKDAGVERGVVKEETKETKSKPQDAEDSKAKQRLIKLEDLEETIREKIEEKLGMEEESVEGEEKEFQDLSSYLLEAAARVQTFTAEQLGFKIFKKWMRQDVPGIGPRITSDQVEKVVNFMDFWSNKQEQMVMPRNIRHWMCPPLDKVPTPDP